MNDSYIYIIIALLPLAACMLVFQVNPYHALVIRGILGAVAALVYAVLGAADVALTEALMGTLLAITLYAVTVRSSLVLRLGVLADGTMETEGDRLFGQLIDDLRTIFRKRYMRLELVTYNDIQALQRALMEKEIHATCTRQSEHNEQDYAEVNNQPYQTTIRIQRIYNIIQTELSSPTTVLTYVNVLSLEEKQA
ncbi:hypothetical protein AMR41_24675 [Hapalosiphon sp. MRB220]|nr:hypothetical protein AMR41_24675 [Hapalosiphon sp. MRB220]